MLRVPRMLVASLLLACGGAPKPATQVALDIVEREVGPDLATRTRASDGIVELAIFVDAGARDADPPQIAAVAAQLAAQRAGEGVSGRAWPDGSELRVRCLVRDAATCVLRLSRGLSARAPSPAEIERLVARLRNARRQALAADPQRAADALALRAVLGELADGLQPLGRAEDDGRVSAEAVGAFLNAHYGPERALLASAGELSIEQLTRASAHAFARSPSAGQLRRSRAPLEPTDGALAELDAVDGLSIALVAPDLARAAVGAEALRGRLRRQRLAREITGHAFPLRGGAVALLRVDTGQPQQAVRAGAHELSLLRSEGTEGLTPGSVDDSLDALLHQAGLRWLVRGEVGPGDRLGLGAGMLVAGGRADRVRERDPDAARRERLTAELQRALQEGLEAAEPSLDGSVDAEGAEITLDNGARIRVRPRSGEQVAIALRFQGGAGAEPPLLSGRTALLAIASTTACAGRGPGSLEELLTRLGARLEPRVDADSWGLVLSAPAAQAVPATRLALDCALDPWLARRHVATARTRAAERLGGPEGPGELRARVAEVLLPQSPGALAPWGCLEGLANTSLDAVRDAAEHSTHGAALSVAVVGPVEPKQLAALIARRAAMLPTRDPEPEREGASAAPPAPAGPSAPIPQPTFGLLVWRAEAPRAHPAGAYAFAALMRNGLARIPGVGATWHDAGGLPGGGWAAVAVVADADTLQALRDGLHAASAAIDRGRLSDASVRAHARVEAARAAGVGRASEEADALAREPFAESDAEAGDAQGARALAEALTRAEAHFLPLR